MEAYYKKTSKSRVNDAASAALEEIYYSGLKKLILVLGQKVTLEEVCYKNGRSLLEPTQMG